MTTFGISPSSGYLAAVTSHEPAYLFIHDLINHRTVKTWSVPVEDGWQASVSFDAREQYVLVCKWRRRISVFGVDGGFVGWLKMVPEVSSVNYYTKHATIHREGEPSLLAVDVWDKDAQDRFYREENTIQIYYLSP